MERFGYRNSSLEVMAYDIQDRFERETQPFNVEVAGGKLLRDLHSGGGKVKSLDRA